MVWIALLIILSIFLYWLCGTFIDVVFLNGMLEDDPGSIIVWPVILAIVGSKELMRHIRGTIEDWYYKKRGSNKR